MAKILELSHRKWGSYSSYLECGEYIKDEFGGKFFKRHGYPHKDERLKVKEEHSGRFGKNSTNTDVKILIPDDYPLVIRQTYIASAVQKANSEDLYTPNN